MNSGALTHLVIRMLVDQLFLLLRHSLELLREFFGQCFQLLSILDALLELI